MDPVGNPDQTEMMQQDLWTPLSTFVERLKEYRIQANGFIAV